MNLQPSGYEPDELPGCSTPRYELGAGDRGRTGTGLLPRDFKSRASAYSATPAFRSKTARSLDRLNSISYKIVFVNSKI